MEPVHFASQFDMDEKYVEMFIASLLTGPHSTLGSSMPDTNLGITLTAGDLPALVSCDEAVAISPIALGRFFMLPRWNDFRHGTPGTARRDARCSTPNETSTAISHARDWLLDHPDDQTVISAMEDLIEVERESLGVL